MAENKKSTDVQRQDRASGSLVENTAENNEKFGRSRSTVDCVRQIKLAIRRLLGARGPKYSVSYPWAPINLQHCGVHGNDDT